jgi:hypothetical protein
MNDAFAAFDGLIKHRAGQGARDTPDWSGVVAGRAFEVADLDAPPRALPQSRRRAAPETSEASIREAGIKVILAAGGYGVVKHQTGDGVRGTPDWIGAVAGRAVVVEFKRPGYSPTPAQLGQLRKWQRAGALAGWADSVEHVRQLLDHLGEPGWLNNFKHPGDGRDADDPW